MNENKSPPTMNDLMVALKNLRDDAVDSNETAKEQIKCHEEQIQELKMKINYHQGKIDMAEKLMHIAGGKELGDK